MVEQAPNLGHIKRLTPNGDVVDVCQQTTRGTTNTKHGSTLNGGGYGGAVAGPVFSEIMKGSLQILNVAPDENQFQK